MLLSLLNQCLLFAHCLISYLRSTIGPPLSGAVGLVEGNTARYDSSANVILVGTYSLPYAEIMVVDANSLALLANSTILNDASGTVTTISTNGESAFWGFSSGLCNYVRLAHFYQTEGTILRSDIRTLAITGTLDLTKLTCSGSWAPLLWSYSSSKVCRTSSCSTFIVVFPVAHSWVRSFFSLIAALRV